MRGSLTAKSDAMLPSELGFDALPYEELAELGPEGFGKRVKNAQFSDLAPCSNK